MLYGALAPWWPLISPPEEYREEAAILAGMIERHARRPVREVLELGSGGGHTASHLTERFRMTLLDAAPRMLAVSRDLNPDCEHAQGDMRTVRLRRTFDAVLVHDAVMHMTTQRDLLAVMRTAAAHLAPGGVALLVPDDTAETFRPRTTWGGSDGERRSARYLEWARHPNRRGSGIEVTYVFVLREHGRPVRIEHEEYRFGLFPRATWLRLVERAGLRARAIRFETTFGEGRRYAFAGLEPTRPGTRRR